MGINRRASVYRRRDENEILQFIKGCNKPVNTRTVYEHVSSASRPICTDDVRRLYRDGDLDSTSEGYVITEQGLARLEIAKRRSIGTEPDDIDGAYAQPKPLPEPAPAAIWISRPASTTSVASTSTPVTPVHRKDWTEDHWSTPMIQPIRIGERWYCDFFNDTYELVKVKAVPGNDA